MQKLRTEEKLHIAIEALEKIGYPASYIRNKATREKMQVDGVAAAKLAAGDKWKSEVAQNALDTIYDVSHVCDNGLHHECFGKIVDDTSGDESIVLGRCKCECHQKPRSA